jgi:hypothetical protein
VTEAEQLHEGQRQPDLTDQRRRHIDVDDEAPGLSEAPDDACVLPVVVDRIVAAGPNESCGREQCERDPDQRAVDAKPQTAYFFTFNL